MKATWNYFSKNSGNPLWVFHDDEKKAAFPFTTLHRAVFDFEGTFGNVFVDNMPLPHYIETRLVHFVLDAKGTRLLYIKKPPPRKPKGKISGADQKDYDEACALAQDESGIDTTSLSATTNNLYHDALKAIRCWFGKPPAVSTATVAPLGSGGDPSATDQHGFMSYTRSFPHFKSEQKRDEDGEGVDGEWVSYLDYQDRGRSQRG